MRRLLVGDFLRVALVATAYVLLARVSLQLAVLPDGSSLLWLSTGAALGLTYWWGYRVGLTGTALGIAYVVWSFWGIVALAVLTALVVSVEIALGVLLLRAWRLNPRLDTLHDVLKLVAVGLLMGGLSNPLNALLRVQFGVVSADHWVTIMLYRWMGDWLGYLLMGSFLLVWWGNPPRRKRDYALLALLTGMTILASWLPFQVQRVAGLPAPTLLILFPPLVAGAFLFQQRGVSLLELVAAASLALFARSGDLDTPIPFDQAIFGWIFLALTFCTLMAVSIPIHQQRAYAQQLEHSRRELEQAYQQVRNILENAPSLAVQIYDAQGRILFWNRASQQLYGYTAEEAIGKTLDALIFTPEQQQEFMALLEQVRLTNQPAPLRERHIHTAQDNERIILSALFPIEFEGQTRYVCADIDITERKALERRLFQAEKLESIGQLAGGVAHDFNNLLTAILGFAELAQTRLPPDHPALNDLERIVQASTRAANLVRQLLGFARKQLTQPRPIAVNTVIQDLLALLQRSIGEHIRLQLNLAEANTTVYMDPAQLEQVVMNLVLNARDAMLGKGGGTLTITTFRRPLTPEDMPLLEREDFVPGECVCLVVEDTGVGIPNEVRERIFEPFFSTKGVGNTGLGLATVYGIVRQNGGFITVESEVGVGTRFTVALPAWTPQVQSHADAASQTPPDTGDY
ncbi:MAG: ATP-binding protein [Fimbriimonadales bacterium]